MMDVKQIWVKRRNDYFLEVLKYFRLMANSGLIVSFFLLLIIGSVYYAKLLQAIPSSFPAVFFLTVIFAIWLTLSPIRTLLRDADLVFLLAIEPRMKHYFSEAVKYSFVIQSFNTVVVFTLFWPMIQVFIRVGWAAYAWFVLLLLVSKWFNVNASWEEQRLPFANQRRWFMILRGMVNAVFAYLLFKNAPVVFLIALIAIMYVLKSFVFGSFKQMHGYQWEHLLSIEKKMKRRVYVFANWFTDVPHIQQFIKPRPWLNWIGMASFSNPNAISRLYSKTFIRANDYFGLYVRLLLIGWLFIYMIPNGWWQFIVVVLFLQLTAVQLAGVYKHHQWNVNFQLYPISETKKKKSLYHWLAGLSAIQGMLFIGFYWVKSRDLFVSAEMALAILLFSLFYLQRLVKKI